MKNQIKLIPMFFAIVCVFFIQTNYLKSHAVEACVDITCNTNADCDNAGTCVSGGQANSQCNCGKDADGNYHGGTTCQDTVCDCTCNPPNFYCLTGVSLFGPQGCINVNGPNDYLPQPYFPNPECSNSFRISKTNKSQNRLKKELTGTWHGEIPAFTEDGVVEPLLLRLCVNKSGEVEAEANSVGFFKKAFYESHIPGTTPEKIFVSFKNEDGVIVEMYARLEDNNHLEILLHDGRLFTMRKIDTFQYCNLAAKKGIKAIPRDEERCCSFTGCSFTCRLAN